MAGVRDHKKLDVWKLCEQVRCHVLEIIARPAFAREWDLVRQLKRAVERTGPVIAEGFSRYYPRDFGNFVRIAKASLSEIIEHLRIARTKNLISAIEQEEVNQLARRGRGAATRLILYFETAEAPHVPRTRKRTKGRGRTRESS